LPWHGMWKGGRWTSLPQPHPPSGAPWSTVPTHRGTAAPSSSGHSISIHTPASQAMLLYSLSYKVKWYV
jgi:hypothetical protein